MTFVWSLWQQLALGLESTVAAVAREGYQIAACPGKCSWQSFGLAAFQEGKQTPDRTNRHPSSLIVQHGVFWATRIDDRRYSGYFAGS